MFHILNSTIASTHFSSSFKLSIFSEQNSKNKNSEFLNSRGRENKKSTVRIKARERPPYFPISATRYWKSVTNFNPIILMNKSIYLEFLYSGRAPHGHDTTNNLFYPCRELFTRSICCRFSTNPTIHFWPCVEFYPYTALKWLMNSYKHNIDLIISTQTWFDVKKQ